MFDLSWTETAVIVLVASLVIGPEELPQLIRTARRWMGNLRNAAKQFVKELEGSDDPSGIAHTLRQLEQDVRYIQDEQGNMYESYSLDDIRSHVIKSKANTESDTDRNKDNPK